MGVEPTSLVRSCSRNWDALETYQGFGVTIILCGTRHRSDIQTHLDKDLLTVNRPFMTQDQHQDPRPHKKDSRRYPLIASLQLGVKKRSRIMVEILWPEERFASMLTLTPIMTLPRTCKKNQPTPLKFAPTTMSSHLY